MKSQQLLKACQSSVSKEPLSGAFLQYPSRISTWSYQHKWLLYRSMEVKLRMIFERKKKVKFKIDLAKSSCTEISMMSTWHPQETSHSSYMFLPFRLALQIFSRCSACKQSTHWGNRERKSYHCCPVDCRHILFAKKHTHRPACKPICCKHDGVHLFEDT